MADRDKRYVDPMFYIPDGIFPEVWDYRDDYEERVDADEVLQSDDTLIDEGDDSTDDSPDTIDTLTVISQKVRRNSDGAQVVDIVVEVEDIPSATKYEFRVTKA